MTGEVSGVEEIERAKPEVLEMEVETELVEQVDGAMELEGNVDRASSDGAVAEMVSCLETCLRTSQNSLYRVSSMSWYSSLQGRTRIRMRYGCERLSQPAYSAAPLLASTS